MRAIQKTEEPVELVAFRAVPGATYDGGNFTPVKEKIRESLLNEQYYLCAYCMRRIEALTMKVEHWQSQSDLSNRQLDYKNLLGVCDGNEGKPWKSQTCDTRKGNSELKFNPSMPEHRIESRIRYLGNGEIKSDDSNFSEQIEKVINLNWTRLRENRRAVIDAVDQVLGKRQGTRTPTEVRKLISQWEPANGRLQEYCGVAVYFLKKKLSLVQSTIA